MSARTRSLGTLSAALLAFERAGLLALAGYWSHSETAGFVVGACVLSAAYMLRAALSTLARTREESVLLGRAMRAVLDGVGAGHLDVSTLQTAVFEGTGAQAKTDTEIVPSLFGEAIGAVLAIAWAASTWPAAVLATTAGAVGASALVFWILVRRAERAANAQYARHADLTRIAFDGIEGSVELHAMGREAVAAERLRAAAVRWSRASRSSAWVTGLTGRLPIAITVGAGLLATHWLTKEPLGTSLLMAAALPPFAGLAGKLIELSRASAPRAALRKLLATPRAPTGSLAPDATLREVHFDAAQFRYAPRGPLALDVALRWSTARPLVLSGKNGSGKSSFLRAMAGLLRPAQGKVIVDGKDLEAIDASAWRAKLAYLPQRPHLPSPGTVRAALSFLEPSATETQMREALGRVELLDVLREKHPAEPLDAAVEELSTGERQRLAIARVLLRDAALYLLDEPDQNLDRRGVEMVASLVRALAEKSAVAIAAHDPDVLAIAGEHVELAGGRVVDDVVSAPSPEGKTPSRASA